MNVCMNVHTLTHTHTHTHTHPKTQTLNPKPRSSQRGARANKPPHDAAAVITSRTA